MEQRRKLRRKKLAKLVKLANGYMWAYMDSSKVPVNSGIPYAFFVFLIEPMLIRFHAANQLHFLIFSITVWLVAIFILIATHS